MTPTVFCERRCFLRYSPWDGGLLCINPLSLPATHVFFARDPKKILCEKRLCELGPSKAIFHEQEDKFFPAHPTPIISESIFIMCNSLLIVQKIKIHNRVITAPIESTVLFFHALIDLIHSIYTKATRIVYLIHVFFIAPDANRTPHYIYHARIIDIDATSAPS